MNVRVLRHACAGAKSQWYRDDRDRPLDPAGRIQADALSQLLAVQTISRLVSSPVLRCVNTLVPLSARTHLPIENDTRLEADSPADRVLPVLVAPDNHDAVFCTHGEVLERLLDIFRERKVIIEADHDEDQWLLLKGSAWELGIENGEVVTLRHHVPVPVPHCPTHLNLGE